MKVFIHCEHSIRLWFIFIFVVVVWYPGLPGRTPCGGVTGFFNFNFCLHCYCFSLLCLLLLLFVWIILLMVRFWDYSAFEKHLTANLFHIWFVFSIKYVYNPSPSLLIDTVIVNLESPECCRTKQNLKCSGRHIITTYYTCYIDILNFSCTWYYTLCRIISVIMKPIC